MASGCGVIVEIASGLIVNRIIWSNEISTMDFGEGFAVTQEPQDQDYTIGGTLIGNAYTPPPEPPAPPAPALSPEDELLFDHENRIRQLEGQPPLALKEFRARAAQ